MERAMFSLIGQHIPELFALMVCAFSAMLLFAMISENWNTYRTAKRMQAADRIAPSPTRSLHDERHYRAGESR
jgi:hypothetical protein